MRLWAYFFSGTEARNAHRMASAAVWAAAFVAVLAAGLNSVSRAISAPSLAPGLFRERIVVPMVREPVREKLKLQEITSEKSDFKIASKVEPEKPKVKEVRKRPVKPVPPKPEKKEVPPEPEQQEVRGSSETGTAGGSSPVAAGSHAASSASDKVSALALIVDVIEQNKRYPRRARQTGTEGVVVLAVRIGADGMVIAVDVARKAASTLLNRAALSAAEKLLGQRLPVKSALTVEVPVVFSLT